MAKRKYTAAQLIEVLDLAEMQQYLGEDDSFIISQLLEFENLFIDDNYEPIQSATPGMSVLIKKGTTGKALIDSTICELLANATVVVNAAGVAPRTDLISVTSALTDDAAESKLFINPTTKITYTNSIAMKERYLPTFHYYPSTSVVPAGETGICTIAVGAGVTSILNADITDIRPMKDITDLTTHRLATPIDHPNGSIGNVAVSATADIALTKLDGKSVDTLDELIDLGLPLNQAITIAWTDGLPVTITETGDASSVTTITYNASDLPVTVVKVGAVHTVTDTIVWTSSVPTSITRVIS